MIYDASGRPLRRTIGFMTTYAPEKPSREPLVSLIGFTVESEEEEEEGEDVGRPSKVDRDRSHG